MTKAKARVEYKYTICYLLIGDEKMLTVKDLRQKGFKVYVKHSRAHKFDLSQYAACSRDYAPTGGITTVEIFYDGKFVASGVAKCSVKDNYNKKLGVRIALGRAIKEANWRMNNGVI